MTKITFFLGFLFKINTLLAQDAKNVNIIEIDTIFWFEYSASTNVYSCPEWDWIGQKNAFILFRDTIISKKDYLCGVYIAIPSSDILDILRKKMININNSVMQMYTKIDSFIYATGIPSNDEIALSQNLIYKKYKVKMEIIPIGNQKRLIPDFSIKDISCKNVIWENIPIFIITNIVYIHPIP